MAKHPLPGRVKTRLAAVLGAERACALYTAFLLDLAGRLDAVGYPVTWAYWPPEAPFAGLLPAARCRPQVGADLGARMAAAIREELAAGPVPVLVLGVDAPHLPLPSLHEAVQVLAGGAADVVLGPAADGGYWLIGMRVPHAELFAGVPWGTANVLASTLEQAGRLGLRTHLVTETFDVDEPADLLRLEAVLRSGAVPLPHTAAVLAARP